MKVFILNTFAGLTGITEEFNDHSKTFLAGNHRFWRLVGVADPRLSFFAECDPDKKIRGRFAGARGRRV
jgi:hypothetical protein